MKTLITYRKIAPRAYQITEHRIGESDMRGTLINIVSKRPDCTAWSYQAVSRFTSGK